jgi:hypothetical protein
MFSTVKAVHKTARLTEATDYAQQYVIIILLLYISKKCNFPVFCTLLQTQQRTSKYKLYSIPLLI